MTKFTESEVEKAALIWLRDIGYEILHGPDIAPGQPAAERGNYSQVILTARLSQALRRLNPDLPPAAIDDAVHKVTRTESPSLIQNNHRFHRFLVNGVPVQYQAAGGRTIYRQAQLLDYDQPERNEWLAINQFSIHREGAVANPANPLEGTRRPDILLFANGLPLAVIELKNAADEEADVYTAFKQLRTYQHQIPQLFTTNAALVAADGTDARLGVLTAGWDWFKPWRAIEADPVSATLLLEDGRTQLETLIRGVFAPHHFLDLIRYFTVFEDHGGRLSKKMAGYHQYHAANKAVAATLEAIGDTRRAGVVWHTQGSGKSLTMLFYAGKIIQTPELRNPTLVVLTDRNDLDEQLFDTFSLGHEILRQTPEQAESIDDLRRRLNVASGHVIFTTIQKFAPPGAATVNEPVSERDNVIFIVDEAHRTQYGLETRYVQDETGVRQVYGLAQHMRDALPRASFIGFTGTPISLTDRNTRHVFGDYIDIYDIQRAVEDKATVPIYYEPRHARLKLNAGMIPTIDPEFEEVTEGQEAELKEVTKSKWASMAAVIGDDDRIALIAEDIVNHYETRAQSMPGKAMIVCMSRAICASLYDAIIRLRPAWHDEDDDKGRLKVVMSGSASDEVEWQDHIRSKRRRKALARRFRDPHSGFDVVIVRDMWLTGFDAPVLHTMYVDKPMQGHSLMQAIARVNRVYPEKTGGLVVSYLPLELQLQEALKDYTEGDRQYAGLLQEVAAQEMMRYYHVVCDMFHGYDYHPFFSGANPAERLTLLAGAAAHVLKGRDPKRDRYIDQVTALGRTFALANPHEDAVRIRDEVGFFQAVKATLVKHITTPPPVPGRKTPRQIDRAVQDIVNRVVAPDGVIDLIALTGLERPDIGILSEEFMTEVQALDNPDLAVELLRRLIEGEIRSRRHRSLVQARSFAKMLEDTVQRYNNQAISATAILTELVNIARRINAEKERGLDLGLTPDELAFYDALEVNDSAVKILGDDTLKEIAQRLVKQVRGNISIDWELKEETRAHMRVIVKRILRRYGYPPDKQKKATETVVRQAEYLSREWSAVTAV